MKNRKRGFSLVELLIVLAVIAALIATITPVALNAIKKSKATQVAQNLKTLASAIENAAYVNGVFPVGDSDAGKIRNALDKSPIELKDLGRDIKGEEYTVFYTGTNGRYTATVVFVGETEIALVKHTLAQAMTKTFGNLNSGIQLTSTGWNANPGDDTAVVYYRIEFDVY